jgi:spore germination protein KA
VSVKGYGSRAITEPPNATTIRGPREGFTEELKTNLMLLKKRIHSDKLIADELSAGRYTKTTVTLCYIDGIADKKVVESLKQKIESIDIDAVHDSSYIQKFLEKSPYSLFKQIGATEKPDIAAAKMTEGRVCIIVDNSPLVLTAPFLLYENFQDSEDYYSRKHKSDYNRILRILSLVLAASLPALHVAVALHQYHIVPLKYLVSLINAMSDMPISPVVEMLLVLFLFDLLHQASVRMPRSIGLALNIVGALVLGDTAVKAGILSPPSVIVGAISGIGLFAVPEQGGAFSLLRIGFVLAAAAFGLYGLLFSLMLLTLYLVGLDTYATPYLAPFAPHIAADAADGILRDEIVDMETRPTSIPHGDKRRLKKAGKTKEAAKND